MPQNISSEMHQMSKVICNVPKGSSDSEGKHSFWAMERLHARAGPGIWEFRQRFTHLPVKWVTSVSTTLK